MVGVIALQGSFSLHKKRLEELGEHVVLVKTKSELARVSALVIPGGESTTLLKLIDSNFRKALHDSIASGLPTLATCAGLILLAKKVENPAQESLRLLDVDVVRNAYGRQLNSFIEPKLNWTETGRAYIQNTTYQNELPEGVFIRAPLIARCGAHVETLISHRARAVLILQRNILAATFHPELSKNVMSIHSLLLKL